MSDRDYNIRLRVLPALYPKQVELDATATAITWNYVGETPAELISLDDLAPVVSIGTVATISPTDPATVNITPSDDGRLVELNFQIPGGVFPDTGVLTVNGANGEVELDAGDVPFSPGGGLSSTDTQSALIELDTNKQPSNVDLDGISGLSPTNDDFMQRKAGGWANRTVPQVKTDLKLTASICADRAAIAALNPTNDTVAFFDGDFWDFSSANLSAYVTADPTKGRYVAPASASTGASGAFVRRVPLRTVYVTQFGAVGDGSTDDAAAVQAAFTFADAFGYSVFFPRPKVSYLINTKVTTTQWRFSGEGKTTFIDTSLNSTLFEITVPSPGIYQPICRGLGFRNLIANGGSYSNSRAIKVIGAMRTDDASLPRYIEHGQLKDLYFSGFYGAMDIQTRAYANPGGNGDENAFAWNVADDIEFQDGENLMWFGISLPYGSGTGNQWRNLHGNITGAAYILTGGAGTGYAVGDILISGHFGGLSGTTAVLFVSTGSTYCRQITVEGQNDAGCDFPIYWDGTPGTTPSDIHIRLNHGGTGVFDGVPATGIWFSDVRDTLGDEWNIGNVKETASTGSQTIDLVQINLADNDGTVAEIFASGVSEGVNIFAVFNRVLLTRATSTTTISLGTQQGALVGSSGATIAVTQTGNFAKVSVTIAPTNTGSRVSVVVVARTGKKRLKII